jgi:hypothetical protein
MDPARIFTESLTPRPELENSLGQEETSNHLNSGRAAPSNWNEIPSSHSISSLGVLII